jgi:HPt (histidine-containing phosphotransfer) domain-containing protein
MTGNIPENKQRSNKSDNFSDSINYPPPDLSYLVELAEGDETFIKEIITHFVESSPGFLHSMKESAMSGDHEKLRFAAHTLLPQLTFVGILAAIPYFEKIESGSILNVELIAELDCGIKIINYGIEDLKKMI